MSIAPVRRFDEKIKLKLKFNDISKTDKIKAKDFQLSLLRFFHELQNQEQNLHSFYTTFNGINYDFVKISQLICNTSSADGTIEYVDNSCHNHIKLFVKMNLEIFSILPSMEMKISKPEPVVATSVDAFNRFPMFDPSNNVRSLEETILYYHQEYKKWTVDYNAPYISFVQSSGCGKTATVLQLGKAFKSFYISCRNKGNKAQPARSIHILEPLQNFLEGKNQDEAVVIIRGLILCCLNFATQKAGFFTIASPEDWSGVMNEFINNIERIKATTLESSLIALNSNSFTFKKPVIFVFDEARTLLKQIYAKLDLFGLFRRALVGCHNVFAILIDTFSRISNFSPAIDPSARPEDTARSRLFPVYIDTPYADVIINSVEARMDLNMLSLAEYYRLDDPNMNDPKNSLMLALLQGRPLWYSVHLSDPNAWNVRSICGFAFEKLICSTKMISLKDLEPSAMLSLANQKFNYLVSPKHSLAEDVVSKNLAICIGISEDRKEIYTIAPSEPILVEVINSKLLYSDQSVVYHNRIADVGQYFKNLKFILRQVINLKAEGALSRGDSGEFITRVLLGIAYDMVSITRRDQQLSVIPVETSAFLHVLLGPTAVASLSLPDEYLEGFTACSHFIRLLSNESPVLTENLAKMAFRRNAALITWRNFVGSDVEIPVAYCKSRDQLSRWKQLLKSRYNAERETVGAIDAELDSLTKFAFISVSVKNVVRFLLSAGFKNLDPTGTQSKIGKSGESVTMPTLRNLKYALKDSINLQILFSLQSPGNRIYKPATTPPPLCKQVIIEGFNLDTFNHWKLEGFNEEDMNECFGLLRTFDLDLESINFVRNIKNGAGMAPVTFYTDESSY